MINAPEESTGVSSTPSAEQSSCYGNITDEALCNGNPRCLWVEYQVGSGGGSGGSGSSAPGSSGYCDQRACWQQASASDCSAFSFDNCTWVSADAVCESAAEEEQFTCGSTSDAQQCSSTMGCMYVLGEGDTGTCVDFSCNNLELEEACSVTSECEWTGVACQDISDGDDDGTATTDSPLPGDACYDATSADECNALTECIFMDGNEEFGGYCERRSCYTQTTQQECGAYSGANCSWDASMQFCGDSSDTMGSGNLGSGSGGGSGAADTSRCYQVSSTEECDAMAECTWETFPEGSGSGSATGTNPNGAPGFCVERDCYQLTNEQSCAEATFANCTWNGLMEVCDSFLAPNSTPDGSSGSGSGSSFNTSPCYGIDVDSDCTRANGNCFWFEQEPVNEGDESYASCIPFECYIFATADTCNGESACTWSAEDSECIAASSNDDECIVQETQESCTANDNCIWQSFAGEDGGYCEAQTCYAMPDANACTGATFDTCSWNEAISLCHDNSNIDETDDASDSSGASMAYCSTFGNPSQCIMSQCYWRPNATTTTVVSTQPPTSASVDEPATTPSVSSNITCPRNCGTATRGGGACRVRSRDGAVLCTSCNDNRVLHRGRCNAQISCRASRVLSGALVNQSCRCNDRNCHYCIQTAEGGQEREVCRRCRNGKYLLNGGCVDTCPATQAGLGMGQWGRRCSDPFTCRGGRVGNFDADGSFSTIAGVTYGCKCPAPGNRVRNGCFQCDFRAGEVGEHCTRCGNGKYLYDNNCWDSCTAANVPAGIVAYNPGNYGRECRAPFTCTNRADPDGVRCKCHRSVGGSSCSSCDIDASGVTCTLCTGNKYLHQGQCRASCPAGTTAVGTGRTGRECQ